MSEPIESLRLSLMQDILPVGLAMVDKARKGGVKKLIEDLASSEESLDTLRTEGQAAAKQVREKLDEFNPGLGNPVVPVEVEVNVDEDDLEAEWEDLRKSLKKIDSHLDELVEFLAEKNSDFKT